jgi:hypothetical protein
MCRKTIDNGKGNVMRYITLPKREIGICKRFHNLIQEAAMFMDFSVG